ncbi:MAG: hypothetical protein H7241_05835 [Novosphingobium sp.]|nr:hypothetical protein [Novosphingobium sp.]
MGNYIPCALFAPPAGRVWVRVDHDALLIDRYDSKIIQVCNDVSY